MSQFENISRGENQLAWSAFCYAAGEMSADEATAFEALLAQDQPAREALARAVELTQAVVSAESLVPVVAAKRASSVWSRRLTWMAVGSAASLLVAVLWSSSGLRTYLQGPTAPSGPSADARELAQAWSQTREQLAQSRDDGLWYLSHLANAEAETTEVASDFGDTSDELFTSVDAPSWMTAAVEFAEQPSSPES
jgi:hypothetical protein